MITTIPVFGAISKITKPFSVMAEVPCFDFQGKIHPMAKGSITGDTVEYTAPIPDTKGKLVKRRGTVIPLKTDSLLIGCYNILGFVKVVNKKDRKEYYPISKGVTTQRIERAAEELGLKREDGPIIFYERKNKLTPNIPIFYRTGKTVILSEADSENLRAFLKSLPSNIRHAETVSCRSSFAIHYQKSKSRSVGSALVKYNYTYEIVKAPGKPKQLQVAVREGTLTQLNGCPPRYIDPFTAYAMMKDLLKKNSDGLETPGNPSTATDEYKAYFYVDSPKTPLSKKNENLKSAPSITISTVDKHFIENQGSGFRGAVSYVIGPR